MAWMLVASLSSLRAEFNTLAPGRDRKSDGAIGDGEHSQSTSDHNPDETGKTGSGDADSINEVHAIDVDKDGPWPTGFSMELAVQTIVRRHRDGVDNRLQNVIYNRRIWSRSWGWTPRVYSGPNAHDHHAHFGARYTTAQENDTRPWGLLELLEDDMDQDTFNTRFRNALKDPEIRKDMKTIAGQGWHNQPLGSSKETAAQDAQSDDAVIALNFSEVKASVEELKTMVEAALARVQRPTV